MPAEKDSQTWCKNVFQSQHGVPIHLSLERLRILGTYKLKNRHFDAVLMDIKMPGMNGVEAFRKIKEIDKKIKVIMMTAYAVDDLVAEAKNEGAFSVIHKPLDLDKLISLVRG